MPDQPPDDRTAPQLRACAAIVECSTHPSARRLSAFLQALADRLDPTEEES